MRNLFLKPNDLVLSKIAKEIPSSEIKSKKIQNIIQTMLNVADGERKDKKKPVMVGLAAPQIGISKRIILVDVLANGKGKVGKIKVYINPQISWVSKQKGEWYEGCYSTGRVYGIVYRPTSIKIQAFMFDKVAHLSRCDLNMREEKYTGYVARIFQHEIDHLNGKVFVDHISDPDKLHWVKKSEFPLYRDEQAWRSWPKKCPRSKWEKIKNPLASTSSKRV